MQTEPSMEKSGAAVWRDLAKLPAETAERSRLRDIDITPDY